MKTRLFHFGSAALASLAASLPVAGQPRPNVILIMTDQHRADALGCTSNGVVITPNLDNLAADGYRFSSAYSSTPSSTPARAGLMTGCSPWGHGMLGFGVQAEVYPHEFSGMLRDAGFATAAIGKNHYNPQDNRHGFDFVLTDESSRHVTPNFESDYLKWFHSHYFGENPFKTGISFNGHNAAPFALPEEAHPTRWTGDRAVELIEGYCSEKPLYLKISFARPHSPYDPPQRFADMYDIADIPEPAVGSWVPESWREPLPEDAKTNAYIGNFGSDHVRKARLHYYANITFIDEQIGRIIAALKEKGMYDNSLIIFLSDHGDMLGDHHMWRKTYGYEGSAAIPMSLKLPEGTCVRLGKGSVLDEVTELRDILPTCLDLLGIAQPEGMDGMSLMPLLRERHPAWRKYLDMEHSRNYWNENMWTGLTDGHIKYIRNTVTGQEQLFDLDKDPYETSDLAQDPSYARKLKEMHKAMVHHLEPRGPEWVRDGELVIRKTKQLYGDNFPEQREVR